MGKSNVPTTITISGRVERIIPANEDSPEMAQIFMTCGDGTFAEFRVKNKFQNGNLLALTKGAQVEISIKPERSPKTTPACKNKQQIIQSK